jgi:serine protease Do
MFSRYVMTCCLVSAPLLITHPQVMAASEVRAVSAKQVGVIAKRTVVRIEASNGKFGSGVIIGRTERGSDNIYTVLTAAHVVSVLKTGYQVVSPVPLSSAGEKKRSKIKINPQRDITFLPKVDLALISFTSKDVFAIGTIGNSGDIDEGSPVYVAGFPKPSRVITRFALQFTGGMISSRLDGEEDTTGQNNHGYDMAYTNVTRAGMSGGPVFDAAGRIVAIHGQGDRNEQNPDESALGTPTTGEKTGFNLGIPIQAFLKLRPEASQMFGAKLNLSPLNYQLNDESVLIGTSNQGFINRQRTRSAGATIVDVTKIDEVLPE